MPGGARRTSAGLSSLTTLFKVDREKTILVTGGTGFVGSYLLRYLLQRGYTRVRALRRAHSQLDLLGEDAARVDWREGDLLDIFSLEDAMRGVDQIYHCAALVSFDPRQRRQMMQVNVEGTANVVNAALHLGVEKLAHLSSVAAIGRSREGETLREDSKWRRSPYNSNYAVSKFLSEQEVWRGMAEGLRVAVVNPSVILGAGRWSEGPLRFFPLAWNNYPFYAPGITGFVDVRDVARFTIRLMESELDGRRYVLNAENLAYGEVFTLIARQLGRKPPRIRVRSWMPALSWPLAWLAAKIRGRAPLLTRETAFQARRVFYYDNHRSRADFDFQYIPIEETIAAACRAFSRSQEEGLPSMILPLAPY
jgi:dihydroflavonol-4-reductase